MSGSAGVANKFCGHCKVHKPIGEFAKNQWACRSCNKIYKRMRRYGVSQTWFEDKMERQKDCCAICEIHIEEYLGRYKGARSTFDVDHCHKTGKARALLCNRCNMVLGQVDDDQELLKRMIRYLKAT